MAVALSCILTTQLHPWNRIEPIISFPCDFEENKKFQPKHLKMCMQTDEWKRQIPGDDLREVCMIELSSATIIINITRLWESTYLDNYKKKKWHGIRDNMG